MRTALLVLPLGLALVFAGFVAPSAAEDQPKTDAPKAEAPAFPATWAGVWKGPCQLIRGGKTAMDFPMELHIAALDGGPGYTWKIVYGAGAKRQVRPYELLPVEGDALHWRIDEKNGIVLDAWFENDRLHNRFGIGEVIIEATYRREGDALHVELTTFGSTASRTSGGEGKVPPVASFPLRAVQRGILRRAAAK